MLWGQGFPCPQDIECETHVSGLLHPLFPADVVVVVLVETVALVTTEDVVELVDVE